MNNKEILTNFAGKFVNKEFRERFVHEALKKPRDLHRRICHEIEKIFNEKYKGNKSTFKEDDICLFLGWSGSLESMPWKEAKNKMEAGGGGYLVISQNAEAFYAETEAYPSIIYAGNS